MLYVTVQKIKVAPFMDYVVAQTRGSAALC